MHVLTVVHYNTKILACNLWRQLLNITVAEGFWVPIFVASQWQCIHYPRLRILKKWLLVVSNLVFIVEHFATLSTENLSTAGVFCCSTSLLLSLWVLTICSALLHAIVRAIMPVFYCYMIYNVFCITIVFENKSILLCLRSVAENFYVYICYIFTVLHGMHAV